jgi:hypothetical protein
MVLHACNPQTQEAEAGVSRLPSQPGLRSETLSQKIKSHRGHQLPFLVPWVLVDRRVVTWVMPCGCGSLKASLQGHAPGLNSHTSSLAQKTWTILPSLTQSHSTICMLHLSVNKLSRRKPAQTPACHTVSLPHSPGPGRLVEGVFAFVGSPRQLGDSGNKCRAPPVSTLGFRWLQ